MRENKKELQCEGCGASVRERMEFRIISQKGSIVLLENICGRCAVTIMAMWENHKRVQ